MDRILRGLPDLPRQVSVNLGRAGTAVAEVDLDQAQVDAGFEQMGPVLCLYWIVPNSRGFSVVMIEQTTESLPSHDRATCSLIVGWLDQRAAETLMRALNMIVSDVLADELSQVRLTQRDDVVEAFLFD